MIGAIITLCFKGMVLKNRERKKGREVMSQQAVLPHGFLQLTVKTKRSLKHIVFC